MALMRINLTRFSLSVEAVRGGNLAVISIMLGKDSFRQLLAADDHFGPFKIKFEADLFEPLLAHGVAELRLVFGIEHQETAAARPDQFAPQRAVGHRAVVPLVYLS